ncbi:MAG TPA: transposase family protein [Actinomycetota bacterium]|nr:transposase family protein [Actinomycetota bacterium]
MGLSMEQRRAVTKHMAVRYDKATKGGKGRILDELTALTGWTRRHARRALRLALHPSPQVRRPERPRVYGKEVLEPLTFIWATLNGPAGKRLAPFMAEIVTSLERGGELRVEPQVRAKLLSISAATIDRLLAPERKRLKVKGRSGTKPGSLLKRQIPIRTFAEWDDARPGFCEVDLVAHDGGDPRGEFCQTLTLTCVATGWTEVRALPNKAQRWCFEALQQIREALPFPLVGLDSDNGSEFINDQLFRYCADRQITFTRSRPYRKNDNCFVEQKNWPVVRQQVGYGRYNTPAELEVLSELYTHLRLYVNFFQPQMKLVSKTRAGAKVSKRYDTAKTPCQRLLVSPDISQETKAQLTDLYEHLNPAELKRRIVACQNRLLEVARAKPESGKEVLNPRAHPFRRTFSPRELSRTSLMRQPEVVSRTS